MPNRNLLQHQRNVADSPIFRKAGLSAHVVDVKLEISASHDREDQTQAVFGLERVREVHDEPARNVGVSSLSTRRYRTLSQIAGPASFGNVSKLRVSATQNAGPGFAWKHQTARILTFRVIYSPSTTFTARAVSGQLPISHPLARSELHVYCSRHTTGLSFSSET